MRLFIFTVAALSLFTTNVRADEDDSFVSYDAIVDELRASAESRPAPVREELNWDEVAVQGGLSLAASMASFEGPIAGSGLLKGFEAHIGFNLFSKVARAEAAFRNFAPETIATASTAEMRDLETRLVFLPVLQDGTLLRMGGGLAERTTILKSANLGSETQSAPFYSLLLGFEHKVAASVAVGPDVSYHSPLGAGGYMRSSWDTTLRLNASF